MRVMAITVAVTTAMGVTVLAFFTLGAAAAAIIGVLGSIGVRLVVVATRPEGTRFGDGPRDDRRGLINIDLDNRRRRRRADIGEPGSEHGSNDPMQEK